MTRVLVDMSLTLFHHGHVRLLRKAAELGHVTVALLWLPPVMQEVFYLSSA